MTINIQLCLTSPLASTNKNSMLRLWNYAIELLDKMMERLSPRLTIKKHMP